MNSDSVKTENDAVDDGEKKESDVDEEWRLKRKLLKCWWREKKECCWWRGSRRSHGGWLIVESLMAESLSLRIQQNTKINVHPKLTASNMFTRFSIPGRFPLFARLTAS